MNVRRLGNALLGFGLLGMCMGSSCLDALTGTSSTTDDAGTTTSLSGAQIEVTVDGTHVGPYVAASTAYATVTSAVDGFGQVNDATLKLHAAGGNATCDLSLQRFGTNITPFSAQAYTVVVPTTGETLDRTASLAGQIGVTAGNLTLSCGGDDCGALFVINALDSAHLEGYLTAQMADPSDGQVSSVVVTFYVPIQ